MKRRTTKLTGYCLLVAALTIVGFTRSTERASATHPYRLSITTHTVVTNVLYPSDLLLSSQLNRVVATGESAGASGNAIAVLNTITRQLVARVQLGNGTAGTALDERRRLIYTLVNGKVLNYQYSVMPALWTISARTGKVLAKHPIMFYPVNYTRGGMVVDGSTDHILVFMSKPTNSQMIQVGTFTPAGMRVHVVDLQPNVLVTQAVVDSVRHRLIIELTAIPTYPGAASAPVVFIGVDTRSGAIVWRQPLSYIPSTVSIQRISGQVWIVARGGRVTILETAQGRIQQDFRLESPMPNGLGPSTIDVDTLRKAGYLFWCGSTSTACTIERLDEQAGRRTTITNNTPVMQYGASALGVDTAHALLVLTDGYNVAFYDERTGARVREIHTTMLDSTPPPTATMECNHGSCTIALGGAVPAYSDVTGATNAGGIVLADVK